MTERLPGWPWTNALPARISWYREALALQRPRQVQGCNDDGQQESDETDVGPRSANSYSGSGEHPDEPGAHQERKEHAATHCSTHATRSDQP